MMCKLDFNSANSVYLTFSFSRITCAVRLPQCTHKIAMSLFIIIAYCYLLLLWLAAIMGYYSCRFSCICSITFLALLDCVSLFHFILIRIIVFTLTNWWSRIIRKNTFLFGYSTLFCCYFFTIYIFFFVT